MNKERCILAAVVIGLVAVAGAFLARVQSTHKLGSPGLKMVQKPVFDEDNNVIGTNTVDLPLRVMNYTSLPLPVTKEELGWLPKDTTYARREYTAYSASTEFKAQISIVLMGTDRTSIHKPEICLTGQGWKIDSAEEATVPIANPVPYELPIMKLTATKQGTMPNGRVFTKRAIYIYWFVAENRLTARHGQRMWWMAKDLLLTGVLPRWAYVTYWSICDPGQEEITYQRLREFIAASVPEYQIAPGSPQADSIRMSRLEP